MNNLALAANEWGLWLVNETDQGTEFISCVEWETIAKYLKDLEKTDD